MQITFAVCRSSADVPFEEMRVLGKLRKRVRGSGVYLFAQSWPTFFRSSTLIISWKEILAHDFLPTSK